MNRNKPLSVNEILDMFKVDLENGEIYWKKPPKYHPRMIGKKAGHWMPNSTGRKSYCIIHIGKVSYRRSYLIFSVANGCWPSNFIDHINGDSRDDRACNLRQATALENSRNRKIGNTYRTLPMGVRELSGKYQARIAVEKRTVYLGTYEKINDAKSAYLNARNKYFGEFS